MRPSYVILIASLAVALTACNLNTNSGPINERLMAWARSSNYLASYSSFKSDLAEIKIAVSQKNYGALQNLCSDISGVESISYGNLPTPDPNLTNALNRAYLAFNSAAQLCLNLISNKRYAGLESVQADMVNAFNLLNVANNILVQLEKKPVRPINTSL